MFDAIAATTLGAFGFFAPDITKVRQADPDLTNEQLQRDMRFGMIGAAAFSFVVTVGVANRSNSTQAYAIWLAIVGALGGAYAYAYWRG